MIHGITYSDEKMLQSQELCERSMEKNGVQEITRYRSGDFEPWLVEYNKDIFTGGRGAGCFWIFKPYFIYKKILQLEDGDILIYSDAGIEWISPVYEIINRMDEDIFFFTNGFPHAEWCKWDCINSILGDKEVALRLFKYKQIQASVIFFRVNQKTRYFVKEWLLYCQMPGFIDDSPSKLPNYSTFAEHRHDQAILTCVAIKHGYTIDHWWPTEYSMHLERTARDSYPCMFRHHRRRDTGKGGGVNPEW